MKIYSPNITGSLYVTGSNNVITGSLVVTQGITGSLFGTSSWANNATSASFASTSSYLNSTTNAFIQNGNSFGTTALLGTNDNQSLALETSGSTRMFISSSGNVGIGTISPSEKLDVNGYVKATGFKTSNGTATQFLMADGSTNSNTYAKTDGTNAAGTWGISITGNAATATRSNSLNKYDQRTLSPSLGDTGAMKFGFTSWNNNNTAPYADFVHMRSYIDSSGGSDNLITFLKSGIGMRIWQQAYGSTTAYSSYKDVAFTDGSNSTGTWGINITGNAATATTLQTARNIAITGDATWNTNFDGSSDVTGALTLTNSGVTAGTYKSVTVDSKGRVTAGTNPTTLSGYGITDAIPLSQKGVANGVATLGSDGLIPTTQLPSYVDDVLEFANLASFPATGESGKIYVALNTNLTYRWGGSSYTQIASGAVQSVNGQTGVVNLTYSDIGAEQAFTKNTAFNKNFGNTSGTVAEGNDSRINNGQTAYNWGNHASAGYAMANHTHTIADVTGLSTELDEKSEKNTNEEWWSIKRLTHPIPFMFKLAGSKSWVLHKPTSNYLIFAPSTTVNNEDWDWTKQIALRDDGRMKCNGYEIAGSDDNYVPTAGGNQSHKRDLLWTKKDTYDADGSTTVITPKGLLTTIHISGNTDTSTRFVLPRSATNGQRVLFINDSSATWVEVYNSTETLGTKSYTNELLEFTFITESDGEGVMFSNGYWYAYSHTDGKIKL